MLYKLPSLRLEPNRAASNALLGAIGEAAQWSRALCLLNDPNEVGQPGPRRDIWMLELANWDEGICLDRAGKFDHRQPTAKPADYKSSFTKDGEVFVLFSSLTV